MRGPVESGSEQAMEMKFGKTGFAGRLFKQNTGLVFGGKEVASATEPAEGVVMEKLRHEGMILFFPGSRTGIPSLGRTKTSVSDCCNSVSAKTTR